MGAFSTNPMSSNIGVPLAQYQSHVIGPTEVVDYSSIVIGRYPPVATQSEPFIGVKVLCRDMNASLMSPQQRIMQIEQNLGFLRNTGCIIRETAASMPDGFWVITCPVPRSQLAVQLQNLNNVLAILGQHFGIVRYQDLVEINVSGRCMAQDAERCLSNLIIPEIYGNNLVSPGWNTPYKIGHVIRINDMFMLLRTRWHLTRPDDITVLSQIISSVFH